MSPAGIWLAAVVMVLDAAANTAGNWSRIQRDPAWPFTASGLPLITVFAVFVLATAPAMLHAAKIMRDDAPESGADPAR